jgi:small subunit ribosomal protein S8
VLKKQVGKDSRAMTNDIIADALTRIRNASMRKHDSTTLIFAKIVESILKIFQEKGYIEGYHIIEDGSKKSIKVNLKYDDNGNSVINEVKRVSKPGRRVYKPSSEIKRFKNGYGTIVVSTSKGVLSNDEAHRLNVGGEILCSIW